MSRAGGVSDLGSRVLSRKRDEHGIGIADGGAWDGTYGSGLWDAVKRGVSAGGVWTGSVGLRRWRRLMDRFPSSPWSSLHGRHTIDDHTNDRTRNNRGSKAHDTISARRQAQEDNGRTTASLLFTGRSLGSLALLAFSRGRTHRVRLLVLGGVGTGVLGRHVDKIV